jgi:hypothetical protein
MKPTLRLVPVLTLSLLLAACAARPQVSAVVGARTGAFRTMTVGLCEDYPKSSRSLEHARRDLETCRESGAKVLRIAFSWLDMEPTPGTYDFSFWDDYIRMAVDEYGIRLIPYICYTPEWASSVAGPDFWRAPPKDPQAFARFAAVLVIRYKDRIHSWELWNEPDNRAYWSGTAGQFADLVKAGSVAVRNADPGATVVLGGIAGTTAFLAELFTQHGISPSVDVVNIHAYFETWHEEGVERLTDYILRVSDLLALHGRGQRLWLAEVGYSNFRRPGGSYVSDQYTARFAFEHTADYQAEALLRCATLAAATGKVDLFAWYRINDLPTDVEVIGDVNNRHLGVLTQDGKPKPALVALRKAASLFNAPFRCVNDSVLILHPLAAPIEAHAFEAENGVLTLIAWHRTALPGEAGQGTEVPPVLPVRFLNADQWLTIPLGRERMTVMNLDTRKVLGR